VEVQRKQYRNLKDGKKSWMTPDRVEKLNWIGFEWKGRAHNAI